METVQDFRKLISIFINLNPKGVAVSHIILHHKNIIAPLLKTPTSCFFIKTNKKQMEMNILYTFSFLIIPHTFKFIKDLKKVEPLFYVFVNINIVCLGFSERPGPPIISTKYMFSLAWYLKVPSNGEIIKNYATSSRGFHVKYNVSFFRKDICINQVSIAILKPQICTRKIQFTDVKSILQTCVILFFFIYNEHIFCIVKTNHIHRVFTKNGIEVFYIREETRKMGKILLKNFVVNKKHFLTSAIVLFQSTWQ